MSIVAPTLKACRMCDETQLVSEFHIGKERDGRRSVCKSCVSMISAAYRLERKEHYAQYERQRRSLPHRVAARRKYAATDKGRAVQNHCIKIWASKNPEKCKAQYIVNNAIKMGKLVRQPCEACGSTVRIHGHHDDYSKPLDVRWLCPFHHAEHHRLERERSQERA